MTTGNALNTNLLTASQAVVTDASKNLASLAYGTASSASSLVQRDSNQNAFANNFTSKATNTVSAGSTSVLTAASARLQNLTGSSTQTYQLPDATTLSVGVTFTFNNNSTGNLTVVDAGLGPICTLLTGSKATVEVISAATSAGSWDTHYYMPSNAAYGTSGLTITGTLSATSTINFSSLTASNAGVTDSSKNLTSLVYTSSNTPSTLVSRDSSGNFSAGTITANITGNTIFTTSSTAVSANATTMYTGVTDNSAARTITLLTADAQVAGTIRIIKDEAGTAASQNNISVTCQGGEQIDGSLNMLITAGYGCLRVISRNNKWFTF